MTQGYSKRAVEYDVAKPINWDALYDIFISHPNSSQNNFDSMTVSKSVVSAGCSAGYVSSKFVNGGVFIY